MAISGGFCNRKAIPNVRQVTKLRPFFVIEDFLRYGDNLHISLYHGLTEVQSLGHLTTTTSAIKKQQTVVIEKV